MPQELVAGSRPATVAKHGQVRVSEDELRAPLT